MLQLVHDKPIGPDVANRRAANPIRLERRERARDAVEARVIARRVGHDLAAYRRPLCPLTVRDVDEAGLRAFAAAPLAVDEPVTLHFAAEPDRPAFVVRGHVVLCEPLKRTRSVGEGDASYAVAIRFDPFNAA